MLTSAKSPSVCRNTRWMSLALTLLVATSACAKEPAASTAPVAPAKVPVLAWEIVNTFPHDVGAFTQGLLYRDGFIYESTGLNGRSSVRKVVLETGAVIQIHRLEHRFFAEGLADWNDQLIQLSWRENTGFVYDLNSFEEQRRFEYPGEGWGLTHDGKRLILSDGTPRLRFLDPETFAETGSVDVTYEGQALRGLNELEYIDGKVFANVWPQPHVVVIDPDNGKVEARIDFSSLLPAEQRQRVDVLNGIAWDNQGRRLFVTGKLWPSLFEIKLDPWPLPGSNPASNQR